MRRFRRMEAKRGPAPINRCQGQVPDGASLSGAARREAAALQQWRAAFRNGPACRRAVRPSPHLRDARCIVRTIRRGCLRFLIRSSLRHPEVRGDTRHAKPGQPIESRTAKGDGPRGSGVGRASFEAPRRARRTSG
jgi:hypothetical protein